MRQSRSSGSAEGVMGNHDPYSDEPQIHELVKGGKEIPAHIADAAE
jgi:hypothetical protein